MSQPFEQIEEASQEFDNMCQERHAMGNEKYGQVQFLQVDSISMALEEIADLANYARYTFIKLYLLRRSIGVQALPAIGKDAIVNPYGG